jgi:hypothetical protein
MAAPQVIMALLLLQLQWQHSFVICWLPLRPMRGTFVLHCTACCLSHLSCTYSYCTVLQSLMWSLLAADLCCLGCCLGGGLSPVPQCRCPVASRGCWVLLMTWSWTSLMPCTS